MEKSCYFDYLDSFAESISFADHKESFATVTIDSVILGALGGAGTSKQRLHFFADTHPRRIIA